MVTHEAKASWTTAGDVKLVVNDQSLIIPEMLLYDIIDALAALTYTVPK